MPEKYRVIRIVDGDTFIISPRWEWGFKTGDRVRPLGYDTPERGQPGYHETTLKLSKLILNKFVILKNPVKLSYGRLLCQVYFRGRNLSSFFPEY